MRGRWPGPRRFIDRGKLICRRALPVIVLATAPAFGFAQIPPGPRDGPFTVAQDAGVFRLRLAWPRAAEEMPSIQVASNARRIILRVPAAALGPNALVPELPTEGGPVRSLTVQITRDQGLIILALKQPIRYEMRHERDAWVLELRSGPLVATAPAAAAAEATRPVPPMQPASGPDAADLARAEAMLLDVVINGQRLRDVTSAERMADGRLVLPLEAWSEAGLKPSGDAIKLPGGDTGYALDSVDGLVYTVDRRQQALNVTAPAAAFSSRSLDTRQALAAPPARPQPGVLLNYDLNAGAQTRGSSVSGAMLEGIFFSPMGSLVVNGLASDANGRMKARRLDTFWQFDMPNRMETLVLGDAIGTGGAWSRAVRYGGIRYGTDFGLRPGFVTVPQPTLSGVAALPSTVEVLVNNQQRVSRSVPPGAFELRDVPVITGAGELNLVVRDLLGRESVIRQSYYLSPRLLAPGLNDHSFEAGWLRTGYGGDADRYTDPFGAATWRRGLTSAVTGELRAELERGRQALGVEIAGILGSWAVARASVAGSHRESESGSRVLLGIERSGATWGGSLQWERQGEGFTQLAQAPSELRPRDRLQASIGGRLFPAVSGGMTFTRETRWDGAPVKIVAASLSASLPQEFNLSLFYSRELSGPGGWRGGLILTRSLGNGIFSTGSATRGSDGKTSADVQVSSITPAGPGVGWRMGASTNSLRALDGGLTWNTTSSELQADAEVARDGETAARLGLRGSLGWLGGLPFASRPIGRGSFAVVRVGELENVPVLRSYQVVTRTNGQGLALVPGLLPYQPNVLEIDATDISLDTELGTTRLEVIPYARSGAVVDFPVSQSRGALVQLMQADGTPVPVGAQARLTATGASFIVARRGEVYMTGLAVNNPIEVSWPAGRCSVTVPLPPTGDSLPRIGPLTCTAGARP